jgi:catechol 2,3-dioxygenase-like lactoylglutathione lyase family enzyme
MGDPVDFALLAKDAVTLSLVKTESPPSRTLPVAVYVNGVAAVRRRLQARRRAYHRAAHAHPWGNHDFVIRDPDGHRIAIGQVEHQVRHDRPAVSTRTPPKSR